MNQNVDSKKGLEEYLAIMLERATVEENYAKALSKLEQQIEKSNLIFMREQLINQLKNKIIWIENFVELIRAEIASQVRETLNQQNQISIKIIEDIKQLEEVLMDRNGQVMAARMDYKLKMKDYEQSAILDMVYQYSFDVPEDQTIKQICKTQYVSIECSKLKKQYQLQTIAYNEFLDVYKTKMESYLFQMEEFEQTKLLIQKDTLLKVFLMEVQMQKQQFQEIEKFNEQIKNTNIQDVIESFIMKYYRPDYHPNQLEFKDYSSFLINEIESIKSQEYHKLKDLIKAYSETFYNIFSDVIEKNNQQSIEKQDLDSLLNGESIQGLFKCFLIHVNSILNDGQFQHDQTIIELLKSNTQNKLLWLIALEIYADKNNYRVPNAKAYESILKWSQTLIDFCSEISDATPLRKLITLSSLLHISVQNKKHYLMHSLKNNQVFNQSDFIEANIIEATYDGLVEEVKEEPNQIERIKRQKINFFTQISKICFTLLIFNSNKSIRNYSDKYLKLLKVAANAVQDLTFQIESYKQL
ncbi:unnamed protein product (macronuclear) [Paramecium tetraurelia]|uniref:F-BAR domain-containing protein n=1 Tax=Paramecium tetraurelia TaxID=5888 RepID=A0EE94_PARTE|nr:uncharacterized protein GSPATT00025956001 [Paramecium tetraurelia]CAK93611.1 unnamed protein product [Paramecium tetraurelia]|eukprot:XP_001461008.1 hypothetical protein (macronuclear) [Paramecium tetraurelia strain d4-2]